jgi:hypothetical protein
MDSALSGLSACAALQVPGLFPPGEFDARYLLPDRIPGSEGGVRAASLTDRCVVAAADDWP